MAAYLRVYDSRHLQADYQEPGSAPEPYARQSSTGIGYLNLFYLTSNIWQTWLTISWNSEMCWSVTWKTDTTELVLEPTTTWRPSFCLQSTPLQTFTAPHPSLSLSLSKYCCNMTTISNFSQCFDTADWVWTKAGKGAVSHLQDNIGSTCDRIIGQALQWILHFGKSLADFALVTDK